MVHNDAAIWAHFPSLRELAMTAIQSRQGGATYNLLNQANFMRAEKRQAKRQTNNLAARFDGG